MSGTLQYMSIDDFYTEYLKRNYERLNKLEVIVVSKDIVSDQKYVVNGTPKYASRYKNINFALEIYPSPPVMEYLYNTTLETFGEKYKYQLRSSEQMVTLCSIADLVVNDEYDVVLLCSRVEYAMNFLPFLKEFIFENFGIIMNDYSDQLKKDDPDYVHDYGDFEQAKKMLRLQLEQAQIIDDALGTFFNKFTSDMASEYRKILMTKSIDELFVIGTKRGIHVNRYKPKEYIVDHILEKMMDMRRDSM